MIGHLLNWMHVHVQLVHKIRFGTQTNYMNKVSFSTPISNTLPTCHLFSCILHQNHLKSCSNLTAILGQNGWEFKSLKQTIHLTAEKKDIE